MAEHRLVIGASSGIGRALARHFAGRGDAVSAFARRQDRLDELGDGITGYAVDVTDHDALSGAVEHCVAANGLLSTIVYCAGMQSLKPVRMLKVDELDSCIRVNLTTPIAVGGLFASRKVSNTDACYCIVTSIAGSRPEPGLVAYSAAKAGADAAVRGLARELGPRRVVGVAPGWLDTEMTQANARIYDVNFRERLAKDTPAGPVEVDQVVSLIGYLVSPQAATISGEIVRIDGGIAA